MSRFLSRILFKTLTLFTTFPVPISNTNHTMFCQTECKKNCVASYVANCFSYCPEGFWMELQHQLWTLCTAKSGHWYIWPLNLPQPQEEKPFCWEREDHTASPTWSSQCHIPRAAFPTMDQTHHTVLPWQKSKEVGDHMILPSTQDRPDLQQIPQLGHSPQVREIVSEHGCRKMIWSHLYRYRNIWVWFQAICFTSSKLFIIISKHPRTVLHYHWYNGMKGDFSAGVIYIHISYIWLLRHIKKNNLCDTKSKAHNIVYLMLLLLEDYTQPCIHDRNM